MGPLLATHGLDTVFKVCNLQTGEELNLLTDWGLLEHKSWVHDWERTLQTGVPGPDGIAQPPCAWDDQNLVWSGTKIMNSITNALRLEIVSDVGTHPTGPTALCKIMQTHQRMTANSLRLLETTLKNMDLRKEPAENVESFGAKVKDVAQKLDQGVIYKPSDLSSMVSGSFIRSTVEAFRVPAMLTHAATQQKPHVKWKTIIEDHIDLHQ